MEPSLFKVLIFTSIYYTIVITILMEDVYISENPVHDMETYRKIKKMSREEMHNFLMQYADGLLSDEADKTIDLPAMENELRQIKGIGEKRIEGIMTVIEKYLNI